MSSYQTVKLGSLPTVLPRYLSVTPGLLPPHISYSPTNLLLSTLGVAGHQTLHEVQNPFVDWQCADSVIKLGRTASWTPSLSLCGPGAAPLRYSALQLSFTAVFLDSSRV